MVATLYVYAAMFLQSATGSNWDLRTMWGQMSILPRAVVITLFILSIYSFGVMIDRALMYSAARKQSRIFVQQVAGALKDGKLDEAIAIAERNKKSHIAKVVPAVWAYNYFTNRVEAFDVEMDNSSMELINYFILRRGAAKK